MCFINKSPSFCVKTTPIINSFKKERKKKIPVYPENNDGESQKAASFLVTGRKNCDILCYYEKFYCI